MTRLRHFIRRSCGHLAHIGQPCILCRQRPSRWLDPEWWMIALAGGLLWGVLAGLLLWGAEWPTPEPPLACCGGGTGLAEWNAISSQWEWNRPGVPAPECPKGRFCIEQMPVTIQSEKIQTP